MMLKVLISAALSLTLLACGQQSEPAPQASPFTAVDITGADWGRDFQLTDHNGQPRALADFKGKVVLLYFGYTHCPDMCPATLAQMAQVRSELGAQGDRVQGLFVTVDPERDTPQVLAQYVPAFDPSFLGLYGDAATTAALAKEFKTYFGAQKADAQGDYTVDHSGGVYVFDPRGRLRLMLRPGAGVDAMAADVAILLKGSPS